MTHSFSHFDQLARQSRDALYLYVDIETTPTQSRTLKDAISAKHPAPVYVEPILDLEGIRVGGQFKKPDAIAAELERLKAKAVEDFPFIVERAREDHTEAMAANAAAIEKEWRRTGLDGGTGHIACIRFALGEGDVAGEELVNGGFCFISDTPDLDSEAYHRRVLDGECEILQQFFGMVDYAVARHVIEAAKTAILASGREITSEALAAEKSLHRDVPIVVAHNAFFDLRFVWKRATVLGVPIPAWWPHDAKPWDRERVNDTQHMWGAGEHVSLDRVCSELGMPGKSDVKGSMVWDMIESGLIQHVTWYCGDDVRRLRNIHRVMLGLEPLEQDIIALERAFGEKEAA